MPYVVIVHATFDNKADADHIYDQAKAVATHASVAKIGTEQERTSHAFVAEEVESGEWHVDREWHIDRFGIVREGSELDTSETPEWIQPQGAHDAYPLRDVYGEITAVTFEGQVWHNTYDGNVYKPGDYGWEPELSIEESDT